MTQSLGGSFAHLHPATELKAPNPFVNRYHWSAYNVTKAVLCGLTLFPIRLVLLLLAILILLLFGYLALPFIPSSVSTKDKEQPQSPVARILLLPVRFSLRLALFSFGFWWVSITDERDPESRQPSIIVANHTSLMDALILGYYFFPSAVGKDSLAKILIFGLLARLTQTIFVHREDPNSRLATRNAILDRAKLRGAPPLLIFPEGTCTNGSCLVTFKHGAFLPGAPVTPVIIRYPHWHLNPSKAGTAGKNPLLMPLQFANFMHVTICRPYVPSEEEQAAPDLFAQNVREFFKARMGVPTTRHSYDDVFLAAIAVKSGIEQDFEAEVLEKLTGLKPKDVEELMKRFLQFSSMKIPPNATPVLTLPDYHRFLVAPEGSRRADHLFHFMNYTDSGYLTFSEALSGLALLSSDSPFPFDDRVGLAFRIYNLSGDERLSMEDITSALQGQSLPANVTQALQDAMKTHGPLRYREFFKLCRKHPALVTVPLEWARQRILNILRGQSLGPSSPPGSPLPPK